MAKKKDANDNPEITDAAQAPEEQATASDTKPTLEHVTGHTEPVPGQPDPRRNKNRTKGKSFVARK